MRSRRAFRAAGTIGLALLLLAGITPEAQAQRAKKKEARAEEDPYAEIVWPPPPNEPRIRLTEVLTGRADLRSRSRLKRVLLGTPRSDPFDRFTKPHAVEIDGEGRVLVSDWGAGAVLRFDRTSQSMDVLGARDAGLKQPLGLAVGSDASIWVADTGLRQVVKLDSSGRVVASFGGAGELVNPTDVAVSPDRGEVFVSDSKAHQIVVFDAVTGAVARRFGRGGGGDGEFHYPTSLTFGPDGDLFVVDQLNARVQVFSPDGEYLDQFGGRGVGFGSFSRPKDIAVDEVGLIYVTDNAFNNVQIFDADFTLLTFVGAGGTAPGSFWGASGIAVRGDEFAVTEQLGRRLQLFRYLVPKDHPARKPGPGGAAAPGGRR